VAPKREAKGENKAAGASLPLHAKSQQSAVEEELPANGLSAQQPYAAAASAPGTEGDRGGDVWRRRAAAKMAGISKIKRQRYRKRRRRRRIRMAATISAASVQAAQARGAAAKRKRLRKTRVAGGEKKWQRRVATVLYSVIMIPVR